MSCYTHVYIAPRSTIRGFPHRYIPPPKGLLGVPIREQVHAKRDVTPR
jgi:hypothetical protein